MNLSAVVWTVVALTTYMLMEKAAGQGMSSGSGSGDILEGDNIMFGSGSGGDHDNNITMSGSGSGDAGSGDDPNSTCIICSAPPTSIQSSTSTATPFLSKQAPTSSTYSLTPEPTTGPQPPQSTAVPAPSPEPTTGPQPPQSAAVPAPSPEPTTGPQPPQSAAVPASSEISPSLQPTDTPTISPATLPEVVIRENTVVVKVAEVTVEEFKKTSEQFRILTAEIINDYCWSKSEECGNRIMKRQTDFVRVKPDDIIITDIREDKEKPGVQFNMYVRFSGAQQGMVTSVLPIAIIEAAIQTDSAMEKYSKANFTVSEVVRLVEPSEPAGGLSGGQIAGIIVAVFITVLLLIIILLLIFFLYRRRHRYSYRLDRRKHIFTYGRAYAAEPLSDYTIRNDQAGEGEVQSVQLVFTEKSDNNSPDPTATHDEQSTENKLETKL